MTEFKSTENDQKYNNTKELVRAYLHGEVVGPLDIASHIFYRLAQEIQDEESNNRP